MELLLWRHAEAEEGRLERADLERPLTPRGDKQAQRMAEWILRHAPKPLRVLASPARRTQQTARTLGLTFQTDSRLAPERAVADLLAAVHWPDGPDRNEAPLVGGGRQRAVLVVGHQPTLGQTAALLLAGEEQNWSVKKAHLWWFSNRVRADETQTVLRCVIGPESF